MVVVLLMRVRSLKEPAQPCIINHWFLQEAANRTDKISRLIRISDHFHHTTRWYVFMLSSNIQFRHFLCSRHELQLTYQNLSVYNCSGRWDYMIRRERINSANEPTRGLGCSSVLDYSFNYQQRKHWLPSWLPYSEILLPWPEKMEERWVRSGDVGSSAWQIICFS